MIRERFFKAFALFAFLFALASAGFSQGTTSRVTGVVTDSSGAAISGATVKLTNEGTNIVLTTQTSDSGAYTFDLIQVGNYEVSVEKQGFKKFISKSNPVNINQPATINAALEVGDVSAAVTVVGSVEQVQTSSSGNLGNTVEQRTLESLPVVGLRGRNPLDLLNYQPGFVSGANTGGGNHVHGSRDRAFNFTLDGIDINESSAGGSNFTPLRPNPDSLMEFQVVTSNFTAELGRSSGAQVTFITKSGTNEFHGNLFEYYQTPRFNSNEYGNLINTIPVNGVQTERPRDQFIQHIFGGSFGGPLFNPGFGEGTKVGLLRDKAFFFVNLQMLRAYETRLVARTVLTQTARTGLFRYVAGGQNAPVGGVLPPSVTATGAPILGPCATSTSIGCINTYNVAGPGTPGVNFGNGSGTGIDPALAAIFNAMPLPNNFTGGDGLNTATFNFAAPQRERQYDFVSKFDFKLADNNLMYVRYAEGKQDTVGDSVNGGLRIFPDSPDLVTTFRRPKNLAINNRWSPTPKFTNEFILGWSKFRFDFANPTPDANAFFNFNLVSNPLSNFTYNARGVRVWQIVNNITYDTSPHTIKAGINFRFGQQADDRSSVAGADITPFVNFAPNGSNSNYTLFGLVGVGTGIGQVAGINTNDLARARLLLNDMLGRVGTRTQSYVSDPGGANSFAPSGTRWDFVANYGEYDFFIQDSWRVKQNLVFDIGVRWEVKLAPKSDGRPILAPSNLVNFGSAPTNALSFTETELFKNDYNNFSPSVGFAWDPWKNGKNSFRVNYRLNYDRFPTQLFAANIFQNAPGNTFGASNQTFGANSATTVGGLIRNIGTATPLTPTVTPSVARTPAAFGTGTITILDKDLKFPTVHSWSVSYQREIVNGIVIEANYIGKKGHNLFGGYDANQVDIFATDPRCPGENFLTAFISQQGATPAATSCLLSTLMSGASTVAGTTAFRTTFGTNLTQNNVAAAALSLSQRTGAPGPITGFGFASSFFQKFPQFTGALNVLDSNDYSFYQAFELIGKRRFKDGLSFQMSYTLAKSKDTRSFDPTFTTVSRANNQSASSTPFNINNRAGNYAWSDFDRRHAIQGTVVYELPVGRGKAFGTGMAKALDYIIGGWQVASGFNIATGRPFTVYSGFNNLTNVVQSTADCNACPRNLGTLAQESGTNFWFDAAARTRFSNPAAGSVGNTGRNYFIGPSQLSFETSLSKKFRFTERWNFDLRLDAKNLTNTPNFALPTATASSTIFGRIRDGVTNNSRRLQLSGKLSF